MCKVSVLVPIYNVDKYLPQCLDSLRCQTLDDIEFICVNDGSTDRSYEILSSYAGRDSRFKVFTHKNSGYGKTMNRAFQLADGRYIGIVEPDDFVASNMFEILYEKASVLDLDFVKADFYKAYTDPSGKDQYLKYHPLLKKGKDRYNCVLDVCRMPELVRASMFNWTGIYRREFLHQYDIRHSETPGAAYQDTGFFWQVFTHANKAMFLDTPLYRYRCDNPDSSSLKKDRAFSINAEYERARNLIIHDTDPSLWDRFKGYFRYKQFCIYLFTLSRIDQETKYDFVLRFSDEMKEAEQLQELDRSLFSKTQLKKMDLLLKDPAGFLDRYIEEASVNPQVSENPFFRLKSVTDQYTEAQKRIRQLDEQLKSAISDLESVKASRWYRMTHLIRK